MASRNKALAFAGAVLAICVLFLIILLGLFCVFSCVFPMAVQHMAVQSADAMRIAVVLDPGHGGRDGGAVTKTDIREKDLNLSVSNRLYDFLTLCGVNTVMTRTEDRLMCNENDPLLKGKIKMTDLKNRLLFAEKFPDAAFVSIHMNTFPVEKYSGLQVYYAEKHPLSEILAMTIQERVKNVLQPQNDRKIKAAGSNIFLLEHITAPAILVECGFLSNPTEAEKLTDAVYQTQLAGLLCESIIQNLEVETNN